MSFKPNWVSAPGATIIDILKERNLDETNFIARMTTKYNITIAQCRGLLNGETEITEYIAEALQTLVGGSTAFWMVREKQYRDDKKRLNINEQISQEIKKQLQDVFVGRFSNEETTNEIKTYLTTWLKTYEKVTGVSYPVPEVIVTGNTINLRWPIKY